MGMIVNDAVDFDNKIGIIRTYLGYYTNEDLVDIFDTESLATILTKFTYQEIRARLINTLTNTTEKEFEIGDIVVINKPTLRDGVYEHQEGLIIGRHWIFDEQVMGKAPLYHSQYDILVQTAEHLDGYSYEVRHEVAGDLILTSRSVDGVNDIMKKYAALVIERPV